MGEGDSVHAMTDDGSGSDVFSSVANSEVRDVDGFPEEVPSEASEIKDSECSRYDSGTNASYPSLLTPLSQRQLQGRPRDPHERILSVELALTITVLIRSPSRPRSKTSSSSTSLGTVLCQIPLFWYRRW